MNKLFDFAFKDRQYRFRAYAISAAVTLVCALAARFVLHWAEPNVILMMAVVFCASATAFILYYLRYITAPDTLTIPKKSYPRRTVPTFVIVAVGFAIISANTGIDVKVQAFVVNLRLASVSRSTGVAALYFQTPEQVQAQLRNRFQKLQSIADISYRYQILVDPKRLLSAQNMIHNSLRFPKLSEETSQAGLIASAKLVGIAALGSTGTSTEVPPAYFINSNVPISNQKLRFLGNHSWFSGGGQFLISGSTVVFDGVNFRGEEPFSESFFVLDLNSTVVVRNSTIENIEQPLDGITWINVQFQHSMIESKGGPFALVNVSFNDCDLRRLTFFTPAGAELQEKIAKANGNPFSFAYEGYIRPTQKP